MRTGRAIAAVVGWLAMGTAATAAERLVLEPYPGGPWYDVVNQSGPGGLVREQMPQGQTPQDPRDVLTAQSMKGSTASPASFITGAFSQLSQSCETVETVGPTTEVEAGRPVSYGRFYCGKLKDKPYGAHVFFKAIRGTDALYVIDRDFRTPVSEHPSAPPCPGIRPSSSCSRRARRGSTSPTRSISAIRCSRRPAAAQARRSRPGDRARAGQSDLTIPSTIFLASANSIMVLSRKNSSFSTPA